MACSLLLLASLAAADFVTETIGLGFPAERGEELALTVIHDPKAVSALESFAAAELTRGASPHLALETIAYGGHEASLAALGRLLRLSPTVVEPYVASALEHAAGRGNPFTLAYAAIAGRPDKAFTQAVLTWAEASIASGSRKRMTLWQQARPRAGLPDPIAERLVRLHRD